MEDFEEVYVLCGDHYEHLVSRRNAPSVSLLLSSLHTLVHHLVAYSAKIFLLTNEQQNIAEDAFKKICFIPRTCIDFVLDEDQFPVHEVRCRAAAAFITEDSLRSFVLDAFNLDHDGESDNIFHGQTQ